MTNDELETLKYPIGKFDCPEPISQTHIENWISILAYFPERLETLVKNLTDKQLDTPYRPGGWTIRQTVHHISDSHHHSYARFKWALTEDKPVIKAYYEDRWAELIDSKLAPIDMSLQHLKAVHIKLVYLLKTLSEEDLNKCFIHPETKKEVPIKRNIGLYAWHSNHHYAHIENVLKHNNWL
ncbi:YfiT family bacillithiol transferase [Confluentibacter flavum]|uniref:Metal-dependent hydrolase n=1 Tax=Confluentibacter flavum TaxID=1909700 RepID=A0A2N3HPZ8_9FLAO|nr:putative metal-dependent hydrolase [Confluentibacter flavum]PKQ46968.1 metal-dependent hydrolase [Confluentibacter flavum]